MATPLEVPLLQRNKRGRKVDETLPKSHQREVQRQFRARRSAHLLDLERRVSLLERENLILRHWAGVLPANRYLLGRGPTGCDTAKPLIADENDPEIQIFLDPNASPPTSHPAGARLWTASRPAFQVDPQHQQPLIEASFEHQKPSYDKPRPYDQYDQGKIRPTPVPLQLDSRAPYDLLPFDSGVPMPETTILKRENPYHAPQHSLPPTPTTATRPDAYYATDLRTPFSRPMEPYATDPNSAAPPNPSVAQSGLPSALNGGAPATYGWSTGADNRQTQQSLSSANVPANVPATQNSMHGHVPDAIGRPTDGHRYSHRRSLTGHFHAYGPSASGPMGSLNSSGRPLTSSAYIPSPAPGAPFQPEGLSPEDDPEAPTTDGLTTHG